MYWRSSITILAAVASVAHGQNDDDISPPHYPSPWMRGGQGWEDAYAKAKEFVSGLTLLEKVNLTTGVGWQVEPCVGNTGSIPRLNFHGICLQDAPLGIRFGTAACHFGLVHTLILCSRFGVCLSIRHERCRYMEHSNDEDSWSKIGMIVFVQLMCF